MWQTAGANLKLSKWNAGRLAEGLRREREGDTHTERDRDTHRQRNRPTDTERDRDSQTEKDTPNASSFASGSLFI